MTRFGRRAPAGNKYRAVEVSGGVEKERDYFGRRDDRYDDRRDRDRGYDRPSPRSAPKRRRSEDEEGRERDDRPPPARRRDDRDRRDDPRDRGRAPPPAARRAGGGWGKKAGVGPCDPEYALKLELLRKKAGVDAAFFELGHLAADSADTLAASVDAKAIGDAFQT